jgi:hypothetical protein
LRRGPVDPEPPDTEPPDTEPSDTEPSDTEPSDTEPSGAEPSGAEPSGAEPSDTEPSGVEPSGVGAAGARAGVGSLRRRPVDFESPDVEPPGAGSLRRGPVGAEARDVERPGAGSLRRRSVGAEPEPADAELSAVGADDGGAAEAVGSGGERGAGEVVPPRPRSNRAAAMALDSLPRDSLGPGGLRSHGGLGPRFVPAQSSRRGPDDAPESPLTDVVPAARTPADEEPAG